MNRKMSDEGTNDEGTNQGMNIKMNDEGMNQEMNDYRSKQCCEKFSNLDTTFDDYLEERNGIITELQSSAPALSSKLWTKYLSKDKHCKKNSGHGDLYSNSSCIPCFNLSIMVDYDIVDTKKSFKVLDRDLIVIKNEIGNIGSEISERDKLMAVNFLKKNKVLLSCGSQTVDNLTFFKSDKFTNNILVWWLIDNIFKTKNVESLTLHTGYICGNHGFLLCDYPTIGGYDKLIAHQMKKGKSIEKTVERVMNQLKSKLMILSEYYFSHGKPDINRLTFGYPPDKEEFELYIIDFTYSSITVTNTRVYPKSVRAEMLLETGSMNIDIEDGMYKISNDKTVLFYYIRHAGLPFYSTSFDYYNFMISLMKKKSFRDVVYNNHHLNVQWEELWKAEDVSSVNEMINDNIDNLEIMSNKWLKCNPF